MELPSARIQWQIAQCSPSGAGAGVVISGAATPARTGMPHPASGSMIQA